MLLTYCDQEVSFPKLFFKYLIITQYKQIQLKKKKILNIFIVHELIQGSGAYSDVYLIQG